MTPDLFWVDGPWRGRLGIVTRPRGGDWLDDEMAALRQARVDVIVSLLTPGEAKQFQLGREGESAAAQKIRYVSFPIADRDVPESVQDSLALFHDLSQELTNGRNVAVHCRQGIGRSALVAAGALIVSGVSVDKALAAVREARGLDVPETAAQRDWVGQLSAGVLR